MSEERKTTQELMNETTDRLIIPLEDNEVVCPTCRGLRMIYKQVGDKGYIETCKDCYNGKLYVCEHCGKQNKTDHCDCRDAQHERDVEFNLKQSKKEQQLFEKAKKVKFNDYNGYFILDGDEHIKDSDEIYDWLYDEIRYEHANDEDLPKYLWAASPEPVFSLDLQDIIYDKCEDGYEDMYSHLDMNSEDLQKAQEYLDKWYKKQGDSVNTYSEDNTVAVLLDNVIKEIREEIKKGE